MLLSAETACCESEHQFSVLQLVPCQSLLALLHVRYLMLLRLWTCSMSTSPMPTLVPVDFTDPLLCHLRACAPACHCPFFKTAARC
jgi:hypothetical protein